MQLLFHEDVDRDHPSVQPYLARIPELRALHAQMGLTDEESRETLQDLARHAHLDRLLHGSPGLRKDWWVERVYNGRLVQLGRLQFERREGYLDLHIPEEGGPLTAAAVDASLARAREVLPEFREGRCSSWLLDPQLAELLGEDSNIIRFQRRFELTAPGDIEDATVFELVFHTLEPDLDTLPQATRLQRAIVAHVRAGGHFYDPTGRLDLWPQR